MGICNTHTYINYQSWIHMVEHPCATWPLLLCSPVSQGAQGPHGSLIKAMAQRAQGWRRREGVGHRWMWHWSPLTWEAQMECMGIYGNASYDIICIPFSVVTILVSQISYVVPRLWLLNIIKLACYHLVARFSLRWRGRNTENLKTGRRIPLKLSGWSGPEAQMLKASYTKGPRLVDLLEASWSNQLWAPDWLKWLSFHWRQFTTMTSTSMESMLNVPPMPSQCSTGFPFCPHGFPFSRTIIRFCGHLPWKWCRWKSVSSSRRRFTKKLALSTRRGVLGVSLD